MITFVGHSLLTGLFGIDIILYNGMCLLYCCVLYFKGDIQNKIDPNYNFQLQNILIRAVICSYDAKY